MHLFPGQGVKHITEGYGVIKFVPQPMKNEKRSNTVIAQFRTGGPISVSINALLPADMPIEQREQLEQKIAQYPEDRGSRELVVVANVEQTKTMRSKSALLPLKNVLVPPSGLTEVQQPGLKCFHGVYIPWPFISAGFAESCSNCHPFEIIAKSSYRA